MMHNVNELYHINGQKLYTKDYIEAHNIPKRNIYDIHSEGGWSEVMYINNNKGIINIYTAQGKKVGYLYGQYTWFDTEVERDEYRAQRNVEREEETKRNKMLKAIMEHYKNMSTEELAKVMATL
jgi:hypothetical protein